MTVERGRGVTPRATRGAGGGDRGGVTVSGRARGTTPSWGGSSVVAPRPPSTGLGREDPGRIRDPLGGRGRFPAGTELSIDTKAIFWGALERPGGRGWAVLLCCVFVCT